MFEPLSGPPGQDPAGPFGWPTKTWQAVLDWSRPLFYDQHEVIIAEGCLAFNIYYVESGTVEVTYGPREKAIILAFIGPGELFGEIGFFDQQARVRTLRATEDSAIRTWDRETMTRMQTEEPALHGAFVTLLAQSICAKFRRILEEREPLVAYAAALSSGRRTFEKARVLPPEAFQNPFWPQVNQMVETFKADFLDLSIRLQQAENQAPEGPFQESCRVVLDRFNSHMEDLRRSIEGQALAGPFWDYVFKECFPYFMRSRFVERAYYKPRGYAGDFLMMEMIYANTARGDGLLGGLLDHWCLNTAAARAMRGRPGLLAGLLAREAEAFAARRRPLRILNLACGSCRELFDFLAANGDRTPVEALCVDADPEALEFIHHQTIIFPHQAVIRLMQSDVLRWIIGREKHPIGNIDFIYSAGLADYLEDPLFQTLARQAYTHLKPGGALVMGNFGPANPNRAFMDFLLQWKLIHRSSEHLQALMAGTPFGTGIEILHEPEGINLFLVARKPEQG
jgi:extracellular factor (EF) 3-hydroxypalmitic acid methyl ester biosynthesis protein